MSIKASSLANVGLRTRSDRKACVRCGIERYTKSGRIADLCRDCTDVERDLANPEGAARQECGSIQGFWRHQSREEVACDPCRLAYNAYKAERRAIKKRVAA